MNSIPQKKLGYWASLSLVIGNIIGVGIFTTTGYMAQYIQSPLILLSAWAVGGFYALSGAVVYGVLAKTYPFSGGDYVYLNKGLDALPAYTFGWSAFFVTYSGSIAALSIAATYYLGSALSISQLDASATVIFQSEIIPFSISWTKITAMGLIVFFTWINYRGITLSGRFQIILTIAIVLFLVLFSIFGTISGSDHKDWLVMGDSKPPSVPEYLNSLIAVLFAYMGWTTAVYVAEEIDKAKRILPRILITGVIVVTALYLWINSVYLKSIPLSEMTDVVNIGSLTAQKLWGETGNIIISLLILIAILGSLNSTILSGPRIYMAMGRDGYFWGKTNKLHHRYLVPYISILLQSGWSIVLVLSGSFNELLSFVVFIAILFSLLAGYVSFKLLIRQKPIRGILIICTLFYVFFCLIIMVNTLWHQPVQSLIGLLFTGLAIPFYYIEEKRKKGAVNI